MLNNFKHMHQVFQDAQKYNNEDQTIADVFILVFYSSYIVLKCCAASLLKALGEITPVELELPKSLQPKVEEIKSYFTSIKEQMEEIDSIITQLRTKIEEFRKRKITEDEKMELKMLTMDLKGAFTIAENYQNEADKALQSLQSDAKSYLWKECGLAVGTTALAAAAGAAVSGVGAWGYARATGQTVSNAAVQNAAITGGILYGVAAIVNQVYSINCKYEERQATCNELKKQLNILKNAIKEKKVKSDVAEGKMDLLLKRQ